MSNPICDTVFDSRDLIEYREELENQILEEYIAWTENHNEDCLDEEYELDIPDSFEEIEFIDEEAFISTCVDLIREHENIVSFIEEFEGYGDFDHGEAIIHEDHFTEYCQDLCEDIGDIPKDLPWYIKTCIDWDAVADNIEQDYTAVSYKGSRYLMRV